MPRLSNAIFGQRRTELAESKPYHWTCNGPVGTGSARLALTGSGNVSS